MSKIRVALVGTDWTSNDERRAKNAHSGVTYYRLIKPLLELGDENYEFTYHGSDLLDEAQGKSTVQFWEDFVGRYDFFIIKHVDNPEAASNLIFFVHRQGKKIVIDFDDNLFELKPDQPGYKYYKPGEKNRAVVSALISFVDGIFVSTQPLHDYYKKHLKEVHNVEVPIFILPNYNDKSEWQFTPVEKHDDKLVIGWLGSTTHFADLKITLRAIEKIMKEYSNVEFNLMGGITHADAPKLFDGISNKILNRIFISGGTQSWDGYPELLSKQPWDIAIAPLTDDEFNRGKSHIKWMEYAMYKIPCVASKVYPYYMPILGQDTIIDGETGILCERKDWYTKLKMLIEDEDLRIKIGEQAHDYVTKNLQYKDHRFLVKEALSYFVGK